MGKYAPLKPFLMAQEGDQVPMSFAEIEQVLGLSLPASKRYPAWWSNNPSNNPMTREWLDAGFETESVNVAGEKLVFRRVRNRHSSPTGWQDGSPDGAHSGGERSRQAPGFGFMKGLLTIEDGYDVTGPSDESWDHGYLGLAERK